MAELKQKRKPTMRQKQAVANIVANGGNVTKAMIDAGYSPATANTPQKLTESEYVQELMVQVGLTDIDGFTVLKEGLAATKATVMAAETDSSFVDIQPDYAVRHKYLETFFKVRGVGRATEGIVTNVNFINVSRDDKGEYGL